MFGDHPFKDHNPILNVVRCPKCKSTEYDAHQNEFENFYNCNKCGNQWSGGSVGAARPDYLTSAPVPGTPAPDDDRPVTQYTGAGFRNPNRNYDVD